MTGPDRGDAVNEIDYGESRETLTTSEVQERETSDEVARFELVEDYIRGLQWSADVPETVRTIVAGNLRGFALWLAEIEPSREGRVHIINGQPCDDPTCYRSHGIAGT